MCFLNKPDSLALKIFSSRKGFFLNYFFHFFQKTSPQHYLLGTISYKCCTVLIQTTLPDLKFNYFCFCILDFLNHVCKYNSIGLFRIITFSGIFRIRGQIYMTQRIAYSWSIRRQTQNDQYVRNTVHSSIHYQFRLPQA